MQIPRCLQKFRLSHAERCRQRRHRLGIGQFLLLVLETRDPLLRFSDERAE